MHKPNTKLYVILSGFFGLATVLLFIHLGYLIECDCAVAWISCFISVFGGILASIVVSWLIDLGNCKKNNELLKTKESQNIKYIKLFLDDLFQSFANTCKSVKSAKQGNWEYWLSIMKENNFFIESPDFYDVYLNTYVDLNTLLSLLDDANTGELKDYYLSTKSDFFAELQLLRTACEGLQKLIFLKGADNIEHIIFQFKDVLSTVLVFSDLSEKQYSISSKDENI